MATYLLLVVAGPGPGWSARWPGSRRSYPALLAVGLPPTVALRLPERGLRIAIGLAGPALAVALAVDAY